MTGGTNWEDKTQHQDNNKQQTFVLCIKHLFQLVNKRNITEMGYISYKHIPYTYNTSLHRFH